MSGSDGDDVAKRLDRIEALLLELRDRADSADASLFALGAMLEAILRGQPGPAPVEMPDDLRRLLKGEESD